MTTNPLPKSEALIAIARIAYEVADLVAEEDREEFLLMAVDLDEKYVDARDAEMATV